MEDTQKKNVTADGICAQLSYVPFKEQKGMRRCEKEEDGQAKSPQERKTTTDIYDYICPTIMYRHKGGVIRLLEYAQAAHRDKDAARLEALEEVLSGLPEYREYLQHMDDPGYTARAQCARLFLSLENARIVREKLQQRERRLRQKAEKEKLDPYERDLLGRIRERLQDLKGLDSPRMSDHHYLMGDYYRPTGARASLKILRAMEMVTDMIDSPSRTIRYIAREEPDISSILEASAWEEGNIFTASNWARIPWQSNRVPLYEGETILEWAERTGYMPTAPESSPSCG